MARTRPTLSTSIAAATTGHVSHTNSLHGFYNAGGGGPAGLVAASNAPSFVKDRADWVCDGTSDNVEIQDALTSYGRAALSGGTFNLAAGGITLGDDQWLTGQGATQVTWPGGTSGIGVAANQRANLANLTLYHSGTAGALLTTNGAFGGRLINVRMYGQHTAKGTATYQSIIGWDITGNSGDWEAYGCHWGNLGNAIRSNSVQNWIFGGRFTHNYVDIKSSGSGCGLNLIGPKFVTATDTATQTNIDLSSGGQLFTVSEGWFEGADTCVIMGTSGGNGVAQMSIRDTYMAASVRCLDLRNGRPVLSHVRCSPNPAKTLTATMTTTGDTPYGIGDFVLSANGAPAITAGTAGDNKYPSGWHWRAQGGFQNGGA